MGIPLDRQVKIITGYKKDIHEIAEKIMDVVQAAHRRIATQGYDFQLTDEEMLKISDGVGRINTDLSLMAGFADRNNRLLTLSIMETGGRAYILLRTSTRVEAIGMLDAWLKIVQSIVPDFTKTPIRFKISAELDALIAKVKALFEKGYG